MDLEEYQPQSKDKDLPEEAAGRDTMVKCAPEPVAPSEDATFTKPLTDITVPEHKMGVFETALSDAAGPVTWLFNGQQVEQMQSKKRFNQISLGNFRRLTIKNCLLHESDSEVKCRWGPLETAGKLFLVDCPFIVSDGLKDRKVPKMSDCTLSCRITNNLAPQEIRFNYYYYYLLQICIRKVMII